MSQQNSTYKKVPKIRVPSFNTQSPKQFNRSNSFLNTSNQNVITSTQPSINQQQYPSSAEQQQQQSTYNSDRYKQASQNLNQQYQSKESQNQEQTNLNLVFQNMPNRQNSSNSFIKSQGTIQKMPVQMNSTNTLNYSSKKIQPKVNMQDFAQFYNQNHNFKSKTFFQNKNMAPSTNTVQQPFKVQPQTLNQQQQQKQQQQQQPSVSDVQNLVAELEKMTNLYEDTLHLCSQKENQIQDLQNQNIKLNELVQDKDALSPSKLTFGTSEEDLQKVVVSLQTKMKILQNDNNYLNKIVEQLREDKDIQKMENVDKHNYIKMQKDQIESIKEQLQSNIEQMSMNDTRMELQNQKNLIQKQERKIKEQQDQIKAFIQENEKLGRYMEEKEHDQQKDIQAQRIEEQNTLIEAFKSDNEGLKQHVSQIEKELIQQKSNFEEELQDYKKQLSYANAFEEQIKKLKQENKKLKGNNYISQMQEKKNQELQNNIQNLQEILQQFKNQNTVLQQQLNESKQDMANLAEIKIINADWEVKVKELLQKNARLCAILDERNNKIEDCQKQIQNSKNGQNLPLQNNDSYVKQSKTIQDLQFQINSQKDEIQHKGNKIRNLEEKEFQYLSEIERLTQQVEILKQGIQEQEKLSSMKIQLPSAQNIDQMNEFIQNMETIRVEQQKHMENLQGKVKSKQAEIQKLQRNLIVKESLVAQKDSDIVNLNHTILSLKEQNDMLQNQLLQQQYQTSGNNNNNLNSTNNYDSIGQTNMENIERQSEEYFKNIKQYVEQIQQQDLQQKQQNQLSSNQSSSQKIQLKSQQQQQQQPKKQKSFISDTQRSEAQEYDINTLQKASMEFNKQLQNPLIQENQNEEKQVIISPRSSNNNNVNNSQDNSFQQQNTSFSANDNNQHQNFDQFQFKIQDQQQQNNYNNDQQQKYLQQLQNQENSQQVSQRQQQQNDSQDYLQKSQQSEQSSKEFQQEKSNQDNSIYEVQEISSNKANVLNQD